MSRTPDASAGRRLRPALIALALAGALTAGGVLADSHAEAAENTPVVFVHGYAGSAANWSTAKSSFQSAGYSADDLFTYTYTSAQSNKTSAEGLVDYVKQVRAATGAGKVDIVNHSMGGMVTSWYLKKLGGQPYVKHVASLAGANHGSYNASSCQTNASCQEMLPGSSFLTTVNSGDETPGDTKYATWYSPCDGMISPYTSTKLNGATNHAVACERHMAFLTDSATLGAVKKFLAT
ncbi:esterase/lipase family protein [Streptomyces malaysiensis]|uniref:Alpha/beta fold hydrolase n=1 Tax=Streptomyces malaysiensis subsp. samsunensis TaxID=459658 RepID=A0A9X2LWP2_STRMQ|nr:alpha/beta fold hydrolase [Streptomyces samsunensis]MCQ8832010.1 alpha/beta fold hydrolase [Streptomyces samsunensis]